MLIVIGGDDHYRDKDEEERAVISRWARRKVASQFNEEFLDGRKSFIFSWNKQHRGIHEKALLHFFDPRKKGQKFEYQSQPKPVPLPKPEEPKITQVGLQSYSFLLVTSISSLLNVCFCIHFLCYFLGEMLPADHVRLQYILTYK